MPLQRDVRVTNQQIIEERGWPKKLRGRGGVAGNPESKNAGSEWAVAAT
jgi:hypothetical protein